MDTDETSRPSTFARLTNIFTGNSNTKILLKWKQSGEQEEWANKAVETLVKKLRKENDGIKNLQNALQSKSDTSKCVTIPRSVDGRLQVKNVIILAAERNPRKFYLFHLYLFFFLQK